MKIILFLFIISLCSLGCSKNENTDEFSQRTVAKAELEIGTGTFQQEGYITYYLVFKDSGMRLWEYQNGKFGYTQSYKYEIKQDSIILTQSVLNKRHAIYANFIHPGNGDKDYLLVRIGVNSPLDFPSGNFDKSEIPLNK